MYMFQLLPTLINRKENVVFDNDSHDSINSQWKSMSLELWICWVLEYLTGTVKPNDYTSASKVTQNNMGKWNIWIIVFMISYLPMSNICH